MKSRRLGSSGVVVSEIGFGAWGIGGETPGATSYGPTDDTVSRAAIEGALEAGIRFFDTSSVYGRSEELLGEALAGADVVIATKGGLQHYGMPPDFSPTALTSSLERSLTRLKREYVDLFQLHNPPRELLHDPGGIPRLVESWKASGRIRAFGVSLRAPEDGFLAIASLAPDALQVNLNLLDQRAISCGLVSRAAADGVALIARTPLAFGFLARDLTGVVFPSPDHRSRWPRAQLDAWGLGARRLLACRRDRAEPPARFALRYALSIPAVATVIPGILTASEAAEDAAAADAGPLRHEELDAVERTYRELGFDKPELFAAAGNDPGKLAPR